LGFVFVAIVISLAGPDGMKDVSKSSIEQTATKQSATKQGMVATSNPKEPRKSGT
jgi:hypothetical protein